MLSVRYNWNSETTTFKYSFLLAAILSHRLQKTERDREEHTIRRRETQRRRERERERMFILTQ